MHSAKSPGPAVYAGLFVTALSVLMFEIALTRIFSVILWYHFSFMAVSLAMFGLSAGALAVQLWPRVFGGDAVEKGLSLFASLYAVCLVLALGVMLNIRFQAPRSLDWTEHLPLIGLYLTASVPFFAAGVVICNALTGYPGRVSSLYAADLAGSGLGALMLVPLLNTLDGPSAVLAIGTLAALGALAFAFASKSLRHKVLAFGLVLAIAGLTAGNILTYRKGKPLVGVQWIKGEREKPHAFEKWNAYSRITVDGNTQELHSPRGWGMSWIQPASNILVRSLWLEIDSDAATVLTEFKGDLAKIEHLKYDVTNLVHHIKPDSHVLVIGAGGGRDILSALAFNQKRVTAVEFNHDTLEILNKRYGDFTGHLDRHPKVRFVEDEARSFIARSRERYDVIQSSFIDTWAATSAGAFVLTENGLYTTQAWQVFLEHLNPGGMLTFSRWYYGTEPVETYRLASLAMESLKKSGVTSPSKNLVIVQNKEVATFLIKKEPFTDRELGILNKVCQALRYRIIAADGKSADPVLKRIIEGVDLKSFYDAYRFNLNAPTDDSPFFFQIHKFSRIHTRAHGSQTPYNPVYVLLGLGVWVMVLSAVIVWLPVWSKPRIQGVKYPPLLLGYFVFIGLAYMLIEIAQTERLIVFLGHPIYGLTVILFVLLLSSGLGSFVSGKIFKTYDKRSAVLCYTALIASLAVLEVLTPVLTSRFRSCETWARISLSVAVLCPSGFLMGTAFPLGMSVLQSVNRAWSAWAWAANGAASIVGSVLAFIFSVFWGIHFTYGAGWICYIGAFAVLMKQLSKSENQRPRPPIDSHPAFSGA